MLLACARAHLTPRLLALALLVGIGLGVTMNALRPEPFGVMLVEGRPDRIMDFAAIRGLACAAWSGDLLHENATSVYTFEAQVKATERWTGVPTQVALPFAYSPTMLWVLLPLCAIPGRWAYAIWSFASVISAGWMILRVRAHSIIPLALVTLVTAHTLALGQTALLTTAGLFFMMLRDMQGEDDRPNSPWSSSVVLWLLTAKPPLALTAGVALLTRGRWGILIRAAGLTLVGTLAVTPWLGAGWLHDYPRFALAGQLAWPIVPLQMSNLCALLHIELGLPQEVATHWTTILWGGSFVAIVLAARARPLPAGPTWALCIMAYLLLCPHVSSTEDVVLFCVLAGMDAEPSSRTLRIGATLLCLAALLLTPAIDPGSDAHRTCFSSSRRPSWPASSSLCA